LDSAGIFEECVSKSRFDAFDPRCRVICAFCAALSIAALSGVHALAAGSVLPFFLLCIDGRSGFSRLAHMLSRVNKVSVFILIFLPLTYPGDRVLVFFSADGARAALIIIWKLNILSTVLLKMAASMGMTRINGALEALRFPLKLRILLLLTMRYIFLLADRMAAMGRAICLRSPEMKSVQAYKAFACMVGTTLVHSADRAERAALAMGCRGGLAGFSQSSGHRWTWKESMLCVVFFLNSACLAVISSAQPSLFSL
jgi:energy-coupling factor transporter transmembrane protein EcfT